MTIVASLLRAGLRAQVRGSTRASFALARWLPSLHAVPVVINERQTMFVDLRNGLTHELLAGSPWKSVPWEPDEQAVMRAVVRPGDVVADIGANIGLHTALLADLVGPAGHVHAFEPNGDLLHPLRRTAGHAGNVTVHGVGLGDKAEVRDFYIPEDLSMASLADWTEGRVGDVHVGSCEIRVLDDLVRDGKVGLPRFIKCDVEGAETLAFRGARDTLNRPDAAIVLYEANARSAQAFGFSIETATSVLRGLSAARFEIFHVQPNGSVVALPDFQGDCDHYNLLAVPAARLGAIRSINNVGAAGTESDSVRRTVNP
jgi:FkbM family methyltransferase